MSWSYDIGLLLLGAIIGWFISLYFYKKEKKESELDSVTLKQIRQYVGAQIRLGNDRRGKIVERPDGSIAIEWTINLPAGFQIRADETTEEINKDTYSSFS